MSVLDVGCNRGMVAFEFAVNGAKVLHGMDSYDVGIQTAKEVFADLRYVETKFAQIDLTQGSGPIIAEFGDTTYDLVLLLAIVHKLRRVMEPEALQELVSFLVGCSRKYVAARLPHGEDLPFVARATEQHGFRLIQHSTISELGPAYVWSK